VSDFNGLNHLQNGTLTAYRYRPSLKTGSLPPVREITGSGLPAGGVQSIYKDSRGRLWIVLFGGIGYLEVGRFRFIEGAPRGGNVSDLAGDTRGNLWIAQNPGGLYRLSSQIVLQLPLNKLGGSTLSRR
jgi:ligand-binding sensor domain-containing protein